MKGTTVRLEELLSPLKQYFLKDTFVRSDIINAPPLRAELFTIEQVAVHATDLAIKQHEINYKKTTEQLLKRLDENEEVLIRVVNLLQESIKEKTPIAPAGEWLLDNFYLIEEQIRIAKRHLPKNYSKGLPKLGSRSGASEGLPRIYDIAIEIISHSDGHLDIHSLTRFIEAYQKISELTLGELWAFPIMLRLALLENLRRVAARIAIDRIDANLAHHWADCIIRTAETNPKNLVLTMADMVRSNPPMVTAFVAEYSRKLQWKGINLTLPISWIDQHLAETGDTISGMVLAENQKQAADHVSMSNSIKSLHLLAKTNWREFVESLSLVEQTLREDVSKVYPQMDFYTRDQYRHSVEKIAKYSRLPENDVAKAVLRLARESERNNKAETLKSHIGYYLIGDGLPVVEKLLKTRRSVSGLFKKVFSIYAPVVYVLGALCLTALITFLLISQARHEDLQDGILVLISFLSALAASHFAIAITNWIATLRVGPKPLPKMDFSQGISRESRTLVVVPTLLTSLPQLEKLIEDLEVRFLGNRDPNLLFGLLTDLKDADTEVLPEDEALVTTIKHRIIELNKKYRENLEDAFYLFHRPRRWNPVDKKWMGYERKRGKLSELNRLLRGGSVNQFSTIVGSGEIYTTVKYVITLDMDTLLPRDAAWKLVGLMSHPLNHPIYDAKKKRITQGYGIIQPRLAISLHGATRSLYTRLHENDSGIDPYTRVTSDVYQDIFGEGSFIGKGIYDVDTFEKVLADRFPENRILSHDLLEGSYARCGFASDIQFYEEYPPRYTADVLRRHRWIRGDWQIGNWFLPWVPDEKRRLTRNPVSLLSKWKIFDNLRRSLIPVVLLLILLLSWTILSSSFFWTMWVLVIMLIPSLGISGWSLIQKPKEITFSRHLKIVFRNTIRNILQGLFTLTCLPYESFISLGAISRSLWRMLVTRKNMLEWNPSGLLQPNKENFFTLYATMWFAPALSVITYFTLIKYFPAAIYLAAPFLILWALSPAIVYWVSRPIQTFRSAISLDQKKYLRELSRKTWAFFETFVNPSENWLPPDNLQQYPIVKIAHRTSPTNIGISLLSNLAAHDFGYVTTTQLLERTSNTLGTLQKLERYGGHFFNWYDTQTLATLHPKYVSTVDSGNLAGDMLTLQQGMLEIQHQKIIKENLWDGLYDTVRILAEKIAAADKTAFLQFQKEFEAIYSESQVLLKDIKYNLALVVKGLLGFVKNSNARSDYETSEWIDALENQINGWQDELAFVSALITHESIPEKYKTLSLFQGIPTLSDLAHIEKELGVSDGEHEEFEKLLREVSQLARVRIIEIQKVASHCAAYADLEYDFLYDKSQHLLSIGYNVDDHFRDPGFYNLLASEARLAIFVAIAQGKIPQDSWFALGRNLTTAEGTPILLSWSGSMFEYLMPNLIMPTYENTLLDETCKGAVKKQIEYGKEQGVPWGISESCYNIVDASLSYQYRAFGVPELGFRRGLGLDLVIAPYATVMALMIDPDAAIKNLVKLKAKGFEGNYGFFESIDYTPSRLIRNKVPALIQSFMVHHQGMSLLSLSYLLCDQSMQKRFEADPNFQTALLLLQERVPKAIGFSSPSADAEEIVHSSQDNEMWVINTPNTPHPEIQLLSNGSYHVMVNNAGSGYSRFKDLALTRWREDTSCNNWGAFCYVRDLQNGEFWSTTYQPTLKEASHYEAIFSQGRVEFRRIDNGIELHTEIVVSPEDNVEIRRVHISNRSRSKRKIEITSYGEVVIAMPAADDAHPAFSNLFVQTEILANQNTILCTRRPRSDDDSPHWMFHLMKVDDHEVDHISYETDRYKFIGRGNSIVHPQVMKQAEPLSDSSGSVLDPVIAIQYRMTIGLEESVILDMVTGIAESRTGCQNLVDKYHDRNFRNRAFELTWTHSQVVLRQINAHEADAQLFNRVASSVIYSNPALRAHKDILIKNSKGQSSLWSHSISGDLPIVLLQVSDPTNITLIKQLMQARSYWLFKGLVMDLVIINEDHSGYRQVLQDQIQSLIAAGIGINPTGRQGNIIVRLSDQISTEDRILLQSVARVIISDKNGTLLDHLNRRISPSLTIPLLVQSKRYENPPTENLPDQKLQFYNGYGGFSADGSEYIITNKEKGTTPLPWSNVIANQNFGTIITESGPSYTWSENAHEFRLTPWNNDPVTDNCGEAYYIRDEESGHFWSPTPFPVKGNASYQTRHGFGYTVFECREDGIHSELWIYVDREAQIKFTVLKIRNLSGRTRTLTATGYAEWVLGVSRSVSAMHIVTEFDGEAGALITRNPYNSEFPNRAVFFNVDSAKFNFTTDRNEFIGRNGTLEKPEAMRKLRLSGKHGAGYDPCSAIQVPFVLNTGQEREIIFRMGASKDSMEMRNLIRQFSSKDAAVESLKNIRNFWTTTLGIIQVKMPDASLSILTNGWLLYQVISCRLWGRSGFYQSGGAFGFRDQLQDTIAVMHAMPALTRDQLLLSASRQFKEGDVQHWWHPPQGRGVRTLCSDDLLWLAFTTSRYVSHTHDFAILSELISFIEGRELHAHEGSNYDLPVTTEQKSTLYDHCKRAIVRSLRFGVHGLPFMGSGDWNDGMNKVGINGQGESVWLGFFLYDVLKRFEPLAKIMNDDAFVETCKQQADELKIMIDTNAWDGEWYRRAYFDDGSALGSASNSECKIDSISQSWAVLSGAGDPDRVYQAMESADKHLVDRSNSLIRLLDPPFNNSDRDPGYIQGYVPGVRENGGQYSHAAIWMVMAVAKLGNHKRTWELLNMINPINHSKSANKIEIYKTEPYVMAADVYGVSPHIGRGGWTWYTGSAGWMYQLILESFLGVRREGTNLYINPCVPDSWKSFEIDYRYATANYHIEVLLTSDKKDSTVTVDGIDQTGKAIQLTDDARDHKVQIRLSTAGSRTERIKEFQD